MIRKERLFYSLVFSAILLTGGTAVSLIFTPYNAYATHFRMEQGEKGEGKFIAYADNVELKGTVVHAAGEKEKGENIGGDLYIIPDKNYENLLTKGNYEYPRHHFHEGYEWYQDNIAANLPAAGFPSDSHPPIIKLELYGYCERNGSDECYYPLLDNASQYVFPMLRDENGNERSPQPGDRIRITGTYSLDIAHSWYSVADLCDFPSARWQGSPDVSSKICFSHAEIHPFNVSRIVPIKPLKLGEPNVESHIVVAPVYTEFYSYTYPLNWPGPLWPGVSCGGSAYNKGYCSPKFTTLVDSSVIKDITSEFFIEAPPKPVECTADVPCEMTLQESNIKQIGNAKVIEKVRQDNGWLIKVRAIGLAGPWTPSIFQATWSVGWSLGSDNIDPDTSIIGAYDANGKALANSSSTLFTSIGFKFSGADNVAVMGFDCSLDGSAPSSCPDGTLGYDELNPGNHTFQVAAKDAAGNVDRTPSTFTWTSSGTPGGELPPPICRTRPDLPQCAPGQSQTAQGPPFEEAFPEATPPPSEGDGGIGGGFSGIDPNTGTSTTTTTTTSTDPNVLDQDLDGYSPATGDCDDSNPSTYPAAMEIADYLDNNCDGAIDNTV